MALCNIHSTRLETASNKIPYEKPCLTVKFKNCEEQMCIRITFFISKQDLRNVYTTCSVVS